MAKRVKQKKTNCKRIVIYGPESTGKTTLANDLANHYKTEWVPEYARDYLQKKWDLHKAKCDLDDLLNIATEQIKMENKMISKSKKLDKSSKEVIAISSNREDVLAEVEKKINENIIKNEDRSLTCRLCGVTKSNKNRTAEMKRHIEVHIEGISYPCQLCNKSFRSSTSLIMHKSRNHRH